MSDEKYRAILERDPTDTQAFVALCNSAERSNDYQYLAQLYGFRAQVIQDTKEIADLYFKAGIVYADKMEQLPEAVDAFLKGFEADRTHAGIGDRLDAIYREAGDWESAVQIAEQRLDALTVADGNGTKTVIRSDLHQQTGEIWEKVYTDRKKALFHYKKAIELDRTNILALYGAREIYLQAGRFKNATKLCELEARAEKDPDRRSALYRELAHLYEVRLDDVPRAVVALKRALKADPKSQEVQAELARLIAQTPLTDESVKDHAWATEFLIRQATEETGERAFDLLAQAIVSTPTSEKALAFIESKAEESGDLYRLARIYEGLLEQIPTEELRQPLLQHLAALYRDKLRDPAAAERWSEALLRDDAPYRGLDDDEQTPAQPMDVMSMAPIPVPSSIPPLPVGSIPPPPKPSFSPVPMPSPSIPAPSASIPAPSASIPAPFEEERGAEGPHASHAASGAAHSAVPVQEPGMSTEAFAEELRLAADRARRSGDDATAELCLLQVLDMFPHDQKAITYLERRFRARSDWLSLRDLLLRSAGAAHLPQAVQTVRLREAARLSEEQLGDVHGAIEAWKIIRSNDPKVRDATDALIRLLEQAEQWEALLGMLDQETETTKSRAKKLEAFGKMAEVYHLRVGDMQRAAAAYENLLDINPDDKTAMEALEDIYDRSERFEEMVMLLRRRADLSTDKAERRDLLFRAALVLRDKLGRIDEAYSAVKEVLAVSVDDVEALVFLSDLDEAAEQWGRLVSVLDSRIRIADPGDKVALLRKKADVALTKLSDKAVAVQSLDAILAISPDDLAAMDALITVHREESDFEALVSVIRMKLASVAGTQEQVGLHRELARVLEQKLGREEEAMISWRAVLDIEADTESLGALARYYERNEKWDEFAEVIERQAAYADDHRERADILFNRASIIYGKLQEEDRAVKELERILQEVDPTHDGATSLLIDIRVANGKYEEAADLLEQRIAYAPESEQAKEMLLRLGAWARSELSDLSRAMDAYERAVALDKDDRALLDSLDAVYTELKEWEKLLKLLYARAKSATVDEERFDLLHRGARICEEELRDTAKAWTWNIELLDRLAHLEQTVGTVEAAARRMGLWKELIDLAAAMTRKAETEEEQVVWWLKAADVFEEKMSDPGQALEAVLRAFGLTPDNEELLDRVDHLAVAVQNWQRLSTVYGVLVKRTTDTERKIGLLKRYATVLLEKGEQASPAFDVIVRAFELDPEDEALLSRVDEVGCAAGRWDDLIRIYNGCASLQGDLAGQIEMKLRAASIYRDKKVDPDSAVITLLEAMRFDPFDDFVTRKVWEEIERLEADLVPTEAGSYWNKLIEAYRILIEEHKHDKERQAALIVRISEVYVDKLTDIAAAFEAMKENQELNPRDESTIDSLEALAAKNDYWEALVEHYQDILDETFEMEIAVMLHKRRARILEEELDRWDEASEHYWQIIQLDSSATVAYEKLMAYYEKARRWNELVNLLERQLDNTEENENKRPILLRIASIWENDIGNKYEAADWYEQVTSLWPDDDTAAAALSRLRADTGRSHEEDDDDDFSDIISSLPDTPMLETDESEAEEVAGSRSAELSDDVGGGVDASDSDMDPSDGDDEASVVDGIELPAADEDESIDEDESVDADEEESADDAIEEEESLPNIDLTSDSEAFVETESDDELSAPPPPLPRVAPPAGGGLPRPTQDRAAPVSESPPPPPPAVKRISGPSPLPSLGGSLPDLSLDEDELLFDEGEDDKV